MSLAIIDFSSSDNHLAFSGRLVKRKGKQHPIKMLGIASKINNHCHDFINHELFNDDMIHPLIGDPIMPAKLIATIKKANIFALLF
jgi:predicted phage tail protein